MQAAVVFIINNLFFEKDIKSLESHLRVEEIKKLKNAFWEDIANGLLDFNQNHSKLDLYLSHDSDLEENGELPADIIFNDFKKIKERGENAEERLFNAAFDVFKKTDLPVLVLGMSFSLFNLDILFEALAGIKERDLVIGPAVGGEYYLLGMKQVEDYLFDFKSRRTASDLDKIIKAARRHNLKTHFLPEKFNINSFKKLLLLREKLIKQRQTLNFSVETQKIIADIFQ